MSPSMSAHDLIATRDCVVPGCVLDAEPGVHHCRRHSDHEPKEEPMTELEQPHTIVRSVMRERIVAWIQAFEQQQGRVPVLRELAADPDMPAATTVKRIFGAWGNAVAAAGFPRPSRRAVTTHASYHPEKNRIYLRKFDHDEARARHAAGESVGVLAAEYGVHYNAVNMVVNPEARARSVVRAKEGRAGTCEVCGGTALAASHAKYTRDGRVVCRRCRYVEMRERLRFDDLGRLVAVRCRSGDCANGERWQPPEMFPRGIRHREVREGGIHGICRACNTRMRRAYRDRGKVPCEGGCGRLVEGAGRADSRTARSGARVQLDPSRPHLCVSCARLLFLAAATLTNS